MSALGSFDGQSSAASIETMIFKAFEVEKRNGRSVLAVFNDPNHGFGVYCRGFNGKATRAQIEPPVNAGTKLIGLIDLNKPLEDQLPLNGHIPFEILPTPQEPEEGLAYSY